MKVMEKVAELKKPYICVGGSSYGGSQSYFTDKKGFFNRRRARSGCGIVAMTDTLSYLTDERTCASVDAYRTIFNRTGRRVYWIPTRLGLSPYRIMLLFPHLLRRNSLALKGRWGISSKKRLARINEMLQNDIPVILNIPRLLPPKYRKQKLPFYHLRCAGSDEKMLPAASTSAHFVVVTGIFTLQDKTYLQISSWGKKFFIDYDEFSAFTKRTPFGSLLGNILYLKPQEHAVVS